MPARHHVVHHPRRRLLDIDGREMPCLRQGPRQHNVPVQNGTGRIRDGVLLVITFRQHRIKRRDGADAMQAIAAALHQLRQLGKTGRGIPLGGRRFANRQGNFSLRHRVAGE